MFRYRFNQIRMKCTISEPTKFMRSSFRKAFGKYLVATNIVSSGVLLGFGDLVQQEVEYRQQKIPKRYDYKRMGRMFLVGLALGPVHHYYYKYLDVLLPKQDLRTVAKKILADQFVASPLFIACFFYGMGILEDKSLKQCTNELSNKFLTVYAADWIVWPPTQFINFYYVPSQYRVFYINVITMIYDVFLSYVKHKDQRILKDKDHHEPTKDVQENL